MKRTRKEIVRDFLTWLVDPAAYRAKKKFEAWLKDKGLDKILSGFNIDVAQDAWKKHSDDEIVFRTLKNGTVAAFYPDGTPANKSASIVAAYKAAGETLAAALSDNDKAAVTSEINNVYHLRFAQFKGQKCGFDSNDFHFEFINHAFSEYKIVFCLGIEAMRDLLEDWSDGKNASR